MRSVQEARAALTARGDVYHRGGILVRVTTDETETKCMVSPLGSPRISRHPDSVLQLKIADSARCRSNRKRPDGTFAHVDVHPPVWLAKTIGELGQWDEFPYLQAVVETPVLKPDGSVLDTPGYDVDTGILFLPAREYPLVPKRPTPEDVSHSREVLEAVFEDFPFAAPVHLSCALASVMTLSSRYAFHGPSPLFGVDGSTAGSGKGLLTDVACMIGTGRKAGVAIAGNNEELRKSITAHAIAGSRTVLLDNVIGDLGGAALCAALTTTTWSDRILGGNTTYNGPLLPVWFATGNNMTLGPDMHRRVCHIRLEPTEERPEERTDFACRDLRLWVEEYQPTLLVAALTVLRGYFAAGRPDMGLTPWGSYEGWSAVVRSAMVWAGWQDPGDAREALRDIACVSDTAEIRLVRGWHELGESSARDAFEALYPETGQCPEHLLPLLEAVEEVARGRKVTIQRLGKMLGGMRKRVRGGLYIDDRPSQGKTLWVAVHVPNATQHEVTDA